MECATDCFVIDGKVYEKRRFGNLREPNGLYVDPRDGLVHCNEDRSYWKGKYKPRVVVDGLLYINYGNILYPPKDWVHPSKQRARYPLKMIGEQRAMRIDGNWYWISTEEVPAAKTVPYLAGDGTTRYRKVTSPRYDVIHGRWVEEGRYYSGKRQMSSRDLRQNGLVNSPC